MHKLPVFETAAQVYRFLLREAGTIVRLSWFPLLLVTVVQYFASLAQFQSMRAAFESGNPQAMSASMWQWQLPLLAAAILGTAVVAVALHRVILLGDRKPGRYLHLAFGATELRFAFLTLWPFLMIPVIMLVIFLIGVIVRAVGATNDAAMWSTIVVAGLVLVAGFVFLVVRLALVFPLIVVEGRYDFRQSWSLTHGNFWRIIGLWLVVAIPFFIVAVVGSVATNPFPFGGLEKGASIKTIFEQLESRLLVQTLLGFLLSIVGGALGVAVLSYSFKALSGRHPDDVWVPDR